MTLSAVRLAELVLAAVVVGVAMLVYGNLLFGIVVALSVVAVAEEYRAIGLERAAVVAVAGWTVSAAAWTGDLVTFVLAGCFAYVLVMLHSRFGLPGSGRVD